MRLLIFLLFICPSAFAGYATMTIEGVKQADGVWTAAGVMDSMGFVRSTGAVSVMGTTRNLPVAMKYSASRLGPLVAGSARLAGPVGWAASVGLWLAESGISSNGDQFTTAPISGSKPYVVQQYCPSSIKYGSGGICDYPVSYPCAGGGEGPSYGATQFYMGNNYYDGWFCRLMWNADDPDMFSNSSPSDSQWQNAMSRPIGLPAAVDAMQHPSMLGKPIPIESTSFTPYSEWYGDPYFKDGNWYRDRVDISPCPTSSQPTRACVDVGPQKLEGQTDPTSTPSSGTATGSTPKEQTDFCKKNPQSIACQELGELKPEEFTPVEKPFQITPQNPWGSGDAQCPAPKVMSLSTGSTVTLSYQPACDFFRGVRPAVLALALLAALYIALGIPVGKGD